MATGLFLRSFNSSIIILKSFLYNFSYPSLNRLCIFKIGNPQYKVTQQEALAIAQKAEGCKAIRDVSLRFSLLSPQHLYIHILFLYSLTYTFQKKYIYIFDHIIFNMTLILTGP